MYLHRWIGMMPFRAGLFLAALFLASLWPMAASAEDLSVSFKFDASSKCSRKSPEIRVGNIPEGTVSFSVRLKDRNVPGWNHGGGTVPNDGSGIIRAGALTSGYNGPCPPSGSHTYRFTVKARDANDDTLAEGAAEQRFP